MQVTMVGDIRKVVMPNRIDVYSAKELELAMFKVIGGGAQKIMCDFSNTEYISSAGLRVFLSCLKQMQRNKGAMVLYGMKDTVREIFDISGFSQLFTIVREIDQAKDVLVGK
ncbi:MAG: STAS domain-containing protein [Negativicutes bacterium]|nr:STAS domain-containing protein [Negativicutes bacterium]